VRSRYVGDLGRHFPSLNRELKSFLNNLISDTQFLHNFHFVGVEFGVHMKNCEQTYFWRKQPKDIKFMVVTCINNIKHFISQLMHTNFKILRLLK
jgi:hypothetical protein